MTEEQAERLIAAVERVAVALERAAERAPRPRLEVSINRERLLETLRNVERIPANA